MHAEKQANFAEKIIRVKAIILLENRSNNRKLLGFKEKYKERIQGSQHKDYKNQIKKACLALKFCSILKIVKINFLFFLEKIDTGNDTENELESFSEDNDQVISTKKFMQTPKNKNSSLADFL